VTTFTIGEVLNQLKDEFDDITISKIRFLESEGLITPDRTESGYRKFTGGDVDRLRYVLRAQRDRYLPLKVIKDELARIDAGIPLEAPTEEAVDVEPAEGAAPAPSARRPLLDAGATDLQLDAGELQDAAGIDAVRLAALSEHGLIGAGPTYDGDDLRVAKVANDLLERGLEARHLRMYRQFADREASLVETLVAPLLRQRNPDSRRAATDRAEHLAASGNALYQALLARQLRTSLRS
jgi:DNA-binding transcriptional MerR regulator